MLFIYGALALGGVETFFVRMAKERKKLGLPTSFLLLSKPEESDIELLEEMRQNAYLYLPEDLFSIPSYLSIRFPLLAPVKKQVLHDLLERVDQIHVDNGMHALLGYHLTKVSNKSIPITVGFYHYVRYLWGGDDIPYYESINRKFVFDYLPQESLVMFTRENRQLYEKFKRRDFSKSQTFRLGVVDKRQVTLRGICHMPLKIVAVGRLVEFKTYNLYMLDVVFRLREKGLFIKFHIYGDGPLRGQIQERIDILNLNDLVYLKGTLEYSRFDQVVSRYDLFIGSGTAIIQAASLGLPSIVGVDNLIEPKTYGYFSDVCQYEYSQNGLKLPLMDVEKMIEDYSSMIESERLNLKQAHVNSTEAFTNEACQSSMDSLKHIKMPKEPFEMNRWIYEFLRKLDSLNKAVNKRHPFHTQFDIY